MKTKEQIQLENKIVEKAIGILEDRLKYNVDKQSFESPDSVKTFLKLKLAESEREIFAIMFLDNRHRLIAYEELFYGTINGASVHPREVVKASLKHNAAAVILAHNHPSGLSEPSTSDIRITGRLKEALALIDITVLDHVIIGSEPTSFAERGLI